MSALAYVIIGLLAAAQYAAGCGVATLQDTCPDDYTAVYSDGPEGIGANHVCIKLDKPGGVKKYEAAKAFCESDGEPGGFLAEPIGYLHEAIYDLIQCKGYGEQAFWIGGSDLNDDAWQWDTSGGKMPTSTPHWQPCDPRQPLQTTTAEHACMWEPDFYFFSCTDGISILAMCEKYPG